MSENKIISFEEFRLKKEGNDSLRNAITQVVNKDLREQEDLIDWYLFHSKFNRYKLFLYTLFYNNHQRKNGINPNAGFIVLFDKKQIESTVKKVEEALKWLGRKYIIVDGNGKNLRQLGESFPYERCNTYGDFYSVLKYYLLNRDHVIIFKEFSLSKIKARKAGITRSLIKIIDDAHFHKISPLSDLVFLDYATFLEKSWEDIGLYLDIMISSYV